MKRKRRIGCVGWLVIAVVLLAGGAFGVWHYALAGNAVALLDRTDRIFAGNAGFSIAASDQAFGPHPAQRLDVIVPDRPGPHPVLVFIHGGGWDSGFPADYRFVGRSFARAGYVVVLPGYRLGADGVYPHMLEDGAAALRWTGEHIAEHGGDPARMFAMGHSAGAYNAMMLALERQWLGREGVGEGFIKGVVGLSGPYDFFPFTSDSAKRAFGHVTDPAITQPVNFVRGDAPPVLLLHGDEDTTVRPRNSIALDKALRNAGGQSELRILSGVDHKGMVIKLAAPFSSDTRVADPILAFLAAHGGAPSAPVQAGGQ